LNRVLHVCNEVGVLGALVAGIVLVRGAYASVRAEGGTAEAERRDALLAS